MADIIIPPNIPPSSMDWRLIDSTAAFQSPFTGSTSTVTRSGARWGCTVNWQGLNGAERHAMLAFIAQLRGKANRVRLFDQSTVQRGSMSAAELIPNNTFGTGTTGWSGGSQTALTASNGLLRAKRTGLSLTQPMVAMSAGATGVAYAPYAARSMTLDGRGPFTTLSQYIGSTTTGSGYLNGTQGSPGYKAEQVTPSGTTLFYTLADNTAGGATRQVGDYYDVAFTSLSRCALLDGGGNLLQQSDTLGSWTLANVTIASNSGVAPDGTTTADGLQETATSSAHNIAQGFTLSTAAQEVAFGFAVKAGTRGFAALEVSGGAGAASSYINLSTGAVSNTGASSNWANARAFSTSLGNGWWLFCLVAQKTDTTTSCTARLYAATAAGTSSYLGVTGADAILGWRGTLAVSSHPTRLTSSVAAIVSPASQSGTGLYIKGLPVSTSGLLQAGDRVEIAGQMVMATAALDSDGAGMGYLQCFPPLRTSSASDVPVIFTAPTMRAVLAQDDPMWSTVPGLFSDLTLQFEEVP